MDFKVDFLLKHTSWSNYLKITKELKIFDRTVDLFLVACTIGIYDDKRMEADLSDEITSIGRNTFTINEDVNRITEFLFQNAILHSKTIDMDLESRKKIAFDLLSNNSEITPQKLLIEFANYGMSIINDCITDNDLETIANIKELLDKYIENSIDSELGIDIYSGL